MKLCRSNMRGIRGVVMQIALWSIFLRRFTLNLQFQAYQRCHRLAGKSFASCITFCGWRKLNVRCACKHPQRSKRNAIQCIWLRAQRCERLALLNLAMKIVAIWFRATNRPISAMEMMVVAAASAATALKSHHKKRPLWGAFFVADFLLNNNNLLSLNALLA